MKVVLLAGGFGTRISEETAIRPKPMVTIGGRPIMWHIMKYYSSFGLNEFIILGGYKVEVIREYFLNYKAQASDFTVDLKSGAVEFVSDLSEDWRVTVLDTGVGTMTGGRLRRARKIIGDDTFFLTYGDGLSDVDIDELLETHRSTQAWCTLTAVSQPGRYGALRLSDDARSVQGFREKGAHDGGLINGGFFVCEPTMLDLIEGDQTVLEGEPMDALVENHRLASHVHDGYWQSMDSLRDQQMLEAQWAAGAPWKRW